MNSNLADANAGVSNRTATVASTATSSALKTGNKTVTPVESISGLSNMIDMYSAILSVSCIVALINYHKIKFPLPISLNLFGLIVSITLVGVDAALAGNPIQSFVADVITSSDLDEAILKVRFLPL